MSVRAEKFIQDIAREAGAAVLKRFGKDGVHYAKSACSTDVVTKADLLSEKILVSRIEKEYPEHGIISEERGSVREGAKYVWVIDPIDGTLNFSRGVPLYGVMVCLVHDGEVMLSAIHLPATDEFFYAKKGKGAYRNRKKICCSEQTTLAGSAGLTSATASERTSAFWHRLYPAYTSSGMHVGSFGSMAVSGCYAAAGRRDWLVPTGGSVWDFAPISLILQEAGCKVTDFSGSPWRFGMLEMVAANPKLHKELLKLTKGI